MKVIKPIYPHPHLKNNIVKGGGCWDQMGKWTGTLQRQEPSGKLIIKKNNNNNKDNNNNNNNEDGLCDFTLLYLQWLTQSKNQ
jgi:hypothetical protein